MRANPIQGYPGQDTDLPLALGALGFGTFVTLAEAHDLLDAFWDRGGRIVDLAPSYGHGMARGVVADYVKSRRIPLKIWDKIGLAYETGRNARGTVSLSYEEPHVSKNTVRDLCLRYEVPIACLQLHAPIPESQRERILEIVATAVADQMVESIGIANHNASETVQLASSAAEFGLVIRQSQVHLNLLEQRATLELLPTNASLGIETWANRVLARGALLIREGETPRSRESVRLQEYQAKYANDITTLDSILEQIAPGDPFKTLVTWPLSQVSVHGIVVGVSTTCQLKQLTDALREPYESHKLQKITSHVREDASLRVEQRPADLFDVNY